MTQAIVSGVTPIDGNGVLTRKAIVMAIGQVVVDKDRNGAVLLLEALLHRPRLGLGHFDTGPAIPLEAGCLGKTAESGHQSARRHGKRVLAILGPLDRNRKTVRDQEQTATAVRGLFGARHRGIGGDVMLDRLQGARLDPRRTGCDCSDEGTRG